MTLQERIGLLWYRAKGSQDIIARHVIDGCAALRTSRGHRKMNKKHAVAKLILTVLSLLIGAIPRNEKLTVYTMNSSEESQFRQRGGLPFTKIISREDG